MIKIERTTKTNMKAKGLCLQNNQIVDIETGEALDLIKLLSTIFGEDEFEISATVSKKEEVDTEDIEEFDVDELVDE